MKKISTLYKKDPKDLSRVINEVDPDNAWVFTDEGVRATRKFDGTACAIINCALYKRYDVKKGKTVPHEAIPCQDPDPITGQCRIAGVTEEQCKKVYEAAYDYGHHSTYHMQRVMDMFLEMVKIGVIIPDAPIDEKTMILIS